MKLIEGKQRLELDYERIYIEGTQRALKGFDGSTDTIRKLAFQTVKFFIHVDVEGYDRAGLENLLNMNDAFLKILSSITPADLMTIFPIRKTYDGERYEMKDYFSAMEAVNTHGLHEPFGTADNARAFLYEYWNTDIMLYQVKVLGIISDLNKMETGESLMERFFRESGANVGTYKKYTDQNGSSYVVDGNGRSVPLVKKFPKHIRLLKGVH